MSSAPNIKLTERLWGGRPKGWGSSFPNTSQAGTNPQPQGVQLTQTTGRRFPKPFRQKPLWLRIWVNLLAGAGILFIVLVILTLVVAHQSVAGTRGAIEAEGEMLMGSARDYVRVHYSQTGQVPDRVAADMGDFEGKYFRVQPTVHKLPDGRIELRCTATRETYGHGVIRFKLANGESEFQWFDENGTPQSR